MTQHRKEVPELEGLYDPGRVALHGYGAGGYLASLTVSLLILRNGRTSDFRMHEQTDSEVSCERISILSEFLPR